MLTTIGIIEDSRPLRLNIERFFSTLDNYKVLFSLDNIFSADASVQPEFILLDIHLNNTNSLDLISVLHKKFPDTSFIVITGDSNNTLLLRAFQNGVKAFIHKPFSNSELLNTIENIRTNGSYVPPVTATLLLNTMSDNNPIDAIKDKYALTARELQVLELIKGGSSYKEIAQVLNVSYHTVNHHIKNLYLKLGVNSKTELLSKYIIN